MRKLTAQEIDLLRLAAASNFVAFCYFYDRDFFRKRPFLIDIAKAFQRIADGDIKSLAVSLPPRAGKSYITTLFAAWLLGKYPDGSVMRNTCTATLYNKFSYDTRDVVRSEKFAEVFPDVRMSSDKANVNGWNTNHAKQVSYFGAGVGGTIIGFGATLVAITDDLFRNMEDAMSETINDKVHSWKEATHDSRKERGCAEIDIGTRWTREDVIGKNSAGQEYDEEIVVPALIEVDGELVSFCEDVLTTEEYIKKRSKTSKPVWSAEYMQTPVDAEGRIFENVKKFTDRDAIVKKSAGAFAYIDVADEGTDFLCMPVGHVYKKDIYITDVIFTQKNTDYTAPECARVLTENGVRYCRVETNSMGATFLKALRKEIKKLGGKTRIIGINNSTHKGTRIFMNSSYVLRKFYFLDVEVGEYGEFLQHLGRYAHNGKNKNDDAPDATTGLAAMFASFLPKLDE